MQSLNRVKVRVTSHNIRFLNFNVYRSLPPCFFILAKTLSQIYFSPFSLGGTLGGFPIRFLILVVSFLSYFKATYDSWKAVTFREF